MEDRPDIAVPVLVCISNLRFPIGISRTVEVVTGSRAKDIIKWGLRDNPAYGRVTANREEVKAVIEAMLRQGYLKREGERDRPVLALTERGEEAAEAASSQLAPGEHTGKEAADAASSQLAPGEYTGGAVETAQSPAPSSELDRLLAGMLVAERDEAQRLVEHLRMYHPREVSSRLEARFAASADVREQSRAVWAAGELCGRDGLEFLIRCARSETVNVRRIAASAIGKVARLVHAESGGHRDKFAQARQALQTLTGDAAPQVAEYAKKALAEFPGPG